MKKQFVYTKTIWHCFLGLIEVVGIPVFLAYLSTYLSPITGSDFIWQWIERSVFCFFFYESIIIYTRKMIIDTRKDAIMALLTAYERAELIIQNPDEKLEQRLLEQIKEVTSNGCLNQLDVLQEYRNLAVYIKERNLLCVQYKILSLRHTLALSDLAWNYTLLLRVFK